MSRDISMNRRDIERAAEPEKSRRHESGMKGKRWKNYSTRVAFISWGGRWAEITDMSGTRTTRNQIDPEGVVTRWLADLKRQYRGCDIKTDRLEHGLMDIYVSRPEIISFGSESTSLIFVIACGQLISREPKKIQAATALIREACRITSEKKRLCYALKITLAKARIYQLRGGIDAPSYLERAVEP